LQFRDWDGLEMEYCSWNIGKNRIEVGGNMFRNTVTISWDIGAKRIGGKDHI